MLRKRINVIISLVLVLSLCICYLAFADTVFVAGAPTTNFANTTNVSNSYGSMSSTQTANQYSAGTIYPGSLQKANDAPQTQTITSPSQNNKTISANTNTGKGSNVISNGVTWETNEEDKIGPRASETMTSPGQHMKGEYDIINGRQTDQNMDYYGPGQYAQNNYPNDAGQPQQEMGVASNANVGQVNLSLGFNMRNVGIANPVISSDGAILVNASTREIYYAKNETKAYAPAGLNALLTGYLLLQYKQLNDVLTVSQTAVSKLESGANNVGLKAGDVITVKDALYALYVKSACDVAKVIAENVAGSEANFVALMNNTALSFGCKATKFANSTGLNDVTQVTTVYDMALIMSQVIQNPTINMIMQTPTYTLPATAHRGALTITTKNDFINPSKSNYYQGVICSRLGYTSKAKYTMTSFVIHKNQYLVSVVMYSNSTQFVDSKRLMNFGKTAVDTLGLTQPVNFVTSTFANTTQTNSSQGAPVNYTTQETVSVNTTTASQYPVAQVSVDTQGSWVKDNNGWYFVKSNNQIAKNEWIITSGKKYCVDQTGYMITGWREFSNGNIYYFNMDNGELRYNTWINTSTGAYYLQEDGSLARAANGQTKTINTQVGSYVIDENGKALQKVSA